MEPKPERRGSAGPRSIAEMTERLTRRSLGRRGFVAASLIAEWPAVVGEQLAVFTQPVGIAFPTGARSGGTLTVQTSSGALAVELQHLAPQLLARVNAHFGYGAVARLAIRQGPVKRRGPVAPPVPPPISEAALHALESRLAGVSDPELKASLDRLGRLLANR